MQVLVKALPNPQLTTKKGMGVHLILKNLLKDFFTQVWDLNYICVNPFNMHAT